MASTLLKTLKAARRVSTPLVAIKTADPAATVSACCAAINGGAQKVQWDVVAGIRALDQNSQDAARAMSDAAGSNQCGPVDALIGAAKLPELSVLFFHNAHRFWGDVQVMQAVWNLRDQFKADGRTIILLCVDGSLPAELSQDVLMLDEPLPGHDELEAIVREQHESAELEADIKIPLDDSIVSRAVEAVQGLAAFPAEQAAAISLTETGFDIASLWERKRTIIGETPGVSVDGYGDTFDVIGGLSQAKKYAGLLFAGPRPPSICLRIEEIEKVMAGAAGDMSGTSGDALQVLLGAMEDNDWNGMIAFGPPGSGKSLFSKSMANTFGKPSLSLDLNACKNSLVGSSEARVRAAIKTILAVGGKRVFCVATANSLDSVPAELQRRFRSGTWMFDVPDADEQASIWKIQTARYGIDESAERPSDGNLTGADIRNVCEQAWLTGRTPLGAYEFVSPLHKAAPAKIERARQAAQGKFLSASYRGVYRMEQASNGQPVTKTAGRRKISVGE